MPRILLSEPTYKRLLKQATSFEDTAETVIARLLDEAEGPGPVGPSGDPEPPPPPQSSRAAPGSVLPVREYWVPILEVLDEMGGSAHSNEVIDALDRRMAELLTPRDREFLKSGEIRWRNRARFARLRMKERGLLSNTSQRGVWELTHSGREFLAHGEGRRWS